VKTSYAVLITLIGLTLVACASIHQEKAQTAFAQGRLDDAANEITSALASSPDNLELKNLAAQIFSAQGVKQYQDGNMAVASDKFHLALSYLPTYAPAYDYLGLIAFSEHKWQDAISYGERGAALAGRGDPLYVKQAEDEMRNAGRGANWPRSNARNRGRRGYPGGS
jgi:tetratricopeptide (TPR) repeat protein